MEENKVGQSLGDEDRRNLPGGRRFGEKDFPDCIDCPQVQSVSKQIVLVEAGLNKQIKGVTSGLVEYVGEVKSEMIEVKKEFHSFRVEIVRELSDSIISLQKELSASTLVVQQVKSQSESRGKIAKIWHEESDKEIGSLKSDIAGDRKAVVNGIIVGVTILSIIFSVCTVVLVWQGSKIDRRYEQILTTNNKHTHKDLGSVTGQ